ERTATANLGPPRGCHHRGERARGWHRCAGGRGAPDPAARGRGGRRGLREYHRRREHGGGDPHRPRIRANQGCL
ncbi:MAG: hypothetical protein AVDCRST_MAG18-1396, partial [uncultured Thermomicrobiales bacterium]